MVMWKDAEYSLQAWAARGCWTDSCFQLQDSSKSFTGLEPLTYLVKWKFISVILVISGLIVVMDIKKLLMLKLLLRPELRKTRVLSKKEYLLILTNNFLKMKNKVVLLLPLE